MYFFIAYLIPHEWRLCINSFKLSLSLKCVLLQSGKQESLIHYSAYFKTEGEIRIPEDHMQVMNHTTFK